MEVVTVYTPLYWLSGYLKLITAAASIITALALPPMLRPILALLEEARVSSQRKVQLEEANRVLEAEVIERRRAQDELLRLRDRFKGIYESSKDAIAYSSPDGTLLDVNDAFLRLTGYERNEVLAVRYQEITPPEYHESEAVIVAHAKETGQPAEYEKEYVRKDGSRVPIELSIFSMHDTQGEIVGMGAFLRDITERRAAERLRAPNRRTQPLEPRTGAICVGRFARLAGTVAQNPDVQLAPRTKIGRATQRRRQNRARQNSGRRKTHGFADRGFVDTVARRQ